MADLLTESKANILIVDDKPENLRVLRDTLVSNGYRVRAATTGSMTIRGVKASPTDLILLDILLPDLDGYEICQRLKADPETADIPIIFLSALNDTFDRVKAFSMGGVDYIAKPFQVEEVLARVNTHLTIRKLQKNLEQQNIQLFQEIEQRKLIEANLFIEKEMAQITLKSIGDAVITTDAQGKITYLNPVAEAQLGWKTEEVKGQDLSTIFYIVNEVTREVIKNPVTSCLLVGEIVNLAQYTILITRNGNEYAIDDSAAPIRDNKGQIIGAVLVFYDSTQSRYLTRQLSWQASHDPLTGLINRREFENQMTQALVSTKTENLEHALCYFDLDRFKIVNDSCGHMAGDELLRQISLLLHKRVRVTDALARLGGDEFGLLLRQCPIQKTIQMAENLKTIIQEFRFIWENQIFSIGVSIGVVIIDKNSIDVNSVMRQADSACYLAKRNGRNQVQVYQRE